VKDNNAEGESHRKRLSEKTPIKGEATVCSATIILKEIAEVGRNDQPSEKE